MSHEIHLQFALTRTGGDRSPPWPQGVPVAEAWGDFDGHYAAAAAQMPRVLATSEVVVVPDPPLPQGCAQIDGAQVRLIVGVLGDAVVLLTLRLDGQLDPLMETLRRLRDSAAGHVVRLRVAGGSTPLTPLEAVTHAATDDVRTASRGWRTPDVAAGHVVIVDPVSVPVFDPDGQASPGAPDDVDAAVVERILYYDAEPYRGASVRTAFAGVLYPVATNRYAGTLAAIGPNGAVLVGLAERFVRAMVLSHVLVRGLRLRASDVRRAAYADLKVLNEIEDEVTALLDSVEAHSDETALRRLRTTLSELSERCGRHRVALAFGAEAMIDIEPVVPSSLVSNYHRGLVQVSRASDMVATATLLVERLESAVTALRIVVETAEREADERRNAHLTKVGGVLAGVALVITFVFGFYGSNASPIGERPLFTTSAGYLVFLVIGLLLAYAVLAAFLQDPWLRLGRLGRAGLRRPGR